MSKIYRIFNGGTDTYTDWNDNSQFPYDSSARDRIIDPNGATPDRQITSIPSPFARLALTKTAFDEVNRMGTLEGDTIYHLMVSHAWDVGELLFNRQRYGDKIEIIRWDKQLSIEQLKASDNEGQRYFADALEKFLVTDAATYHFDKMQALYMLNYIDGPEPMNILGATSPATLFFASANDMDYVGRDVVFADNKKPFSKDLQPLYKRDFNYVQYIWALSKTIPNFAALFPEVQRYLNASYEKLNTEQREALRAINSQPAIPAFCKPLEMSGEQGKNIVEIMDQPLTFYRHSQRHAHTLREGFHLHHRLSIAHETLQFVGGEICEHQGLERQ